MKMSTWKIAIATFAALATMIDPAQAGNPNCTEVDGDYIVSFPRGANLGNEMKAAAGRQIETKFTYDSVLNGFAATLTAEQACAFKKRPGAIVEFDGEATASAPRTTSVDLWGLDRIDEIALPLNGSLDNPFTGAGVRAYIVDTGINSGHVQFGNRVSKSGFTSIKDQWGLNDCNGHGTHVAGTVGGSTYGVSTAVSLYSVRVLDCRGSGKWSGVIAGLNWIGKNNGSAKAVVNMSLGGGANSNLDTAVRNLIAKNITVVVAAGNDGANACNYSPARVTEAITVGAITLVNSSTEAIANYSNTGLCVDIYAPGTAITSSWIGATTATKSISGTSMATPHVAGAIASYLEANSSTNLVGDLSKNANTLSSPQGTIKTLCLPTGCANN